MAIARRESTMQILKLSSFPIEQVPNMQALELDLAAWFVSRDYGVRLLAYSQAFQMRSAIARVQQAQAGMERVQQAITPLLRAIDARQEGQSRHGACSAGHHAASARDRQIARGRLCSRSGT